MQETGTSGMCPDRWQLQSNSWTQSIGEYKEYKTQHYTDSNII